MILTSTTTAGLSLFRRLIDHSSDAFFIVDPSDERILDVNEQACRSLGYTREELLALRMRDVEQAYDGFSWSEQADKARLGEVDLIETGQKRKNGEVFPVEISLNHVAIDGAAYIVATARDITEKKQLQAKCLRAQRLESIGRLAGGIAHDLNNVLAPVLLSIELLRARMPDEEAGRILDLIESSTRRGASLVKQILTFARGAKGERSVVQLGEVIRETLALGREAFPRSIQVQSAVAPDLWSISGDRTQLHQVLMNLCVNACDAMSEGGVLEVRAENRWVDLPRPHAQRTAQPGPYVVLSIRDTGYGISPDLLDRIFEPFFTTKEFGKGTGLGLATALGIVENHDGYISVQSELGKGSCFEVFLSAREHVPVAARSASSQPIKGGASRRILLVDDEANVRELAQYILRANNYQVIPAQDGAEALTIYAQKHHEFDAVVMDMAMPVMDGAMAIKEMRKMNPAARILAVSGYTDGRGLQTRAGQNDIPLLNKPYSADQLLRALGAFWHSDTHTAEC